MKEESPNEFPPIDAKDYYTVMIHFYRGELGRIMIWRQRLDVTTNWAIVGATAMITFGLSAESNTHLIFMFANFLVFLLLTIEARRYRFYDAFRARVRMLEAHFIMPVMMQVREAVQTAPVNEPMMRAWWKSMPSSARRSMFGVIAVLSP